MPEGKSFTRFFPVIARVLMGLLFTLTGLNGFLNFLPQPKEPMPDFAVALMKTGYMFPMIMGTQLVCAVMFLSGRFLPLALALLAPVVVNIVALHLFLEPKGLPMAFFVLFLEVYLAWAYRGAFKPMLAMNAVPGAAKSP